jgi:hypothetical protein
LRGRPPQIWRQVVYLDARGNPTDEGRAVKVRVITTQQNPVLPMADEPHALMQFFTYDHLRHDLQPVSAQFAEMAQMMDEVLPTNPEKTVALRKLLEAKDCAVRALLFKYTSPP